MLALLSGRWQNRSLAADRPLTPAPDPMSKTPTSGTSLHRELLHDPQQLSVLYDQAAQEFIQVSAHDGHFEGWSEEALTWPKTEALTGDTGGKAHDRRLELVGTIFRGVPPLREARLREAAKERRTRRKEYEANAKAAHLERCEERQGLRKAFIREDIK